MREVRFACLSLRGTGRVRTRMRACARTCVRDVHARARVANVMRDETKVPKSKCRNVKVNAKWENAGVNQGMLG